MRVQLFSHLYFGKRVTIHFKNCGKICEWVSDYVLSTHSTVCVINLCVVMCWLRMKWLRCSKCCRETKQKQDKKITPHTQTHRHKLQPYDECVIWREWTQLQLDCEMLDCIQCASELCSNAVYLVVTHSATRERKLYRMYQSGCCDSFISH